MPLFVRALLGLVLILVAPLSHSADSNDFLPVHEAFKVSARTEGNLIHYTWTIADGYYLYKHRFSFTPTPNSQGQLDEPAFSQEGEWQDDPIFGRVLVFYKQVDIRVPVLQTSDEFIEINASYQGCADKGLCYVPQTYTDMFQVKADAISANPEGKMRNPSVDTTGKPVALAPTADTGIDRNDALNLERFLDRSSLFTSLAIFFLIGIGLTFTPCVLPMIPILSGIILGQGKDLSRRRAAGLSLVYVLGMASAYAVAGVIAGLSGKNLSLMLQTPAVLITFAGLFALLSLSMFGFYELQLPEFLRDRLNRFSQQQKGGTWLGVAVIGMLSALIVSPCVSAPLAGALLYISKTGDWQLGGASLLAMGLGMGVPLMAVGIGGANLLPRAGGWMDNVKALFGVLLLAVALWLIKHLLPETLLTLGWALLAILTGLYLGALDATTSPKGKLFKAMGILALAAGAALAFNAVAPQTTSTNVGQRATKSLFQTVRTQADLNSALASAKARNQPVMLDFYADWCVSCIEMEQENFSQPEVRSQLSDYLWLQVDLTNNPEDQAILDHFRIPGPPAILFFDRNGQERDTARLYAFKPHNEFLAHLSRHALGNR